MIHMISNKKAKEILGDKAKQTMAAKKVHLHVLVICNKKSWKR